MAGSRGAIRGVAKVPEGVPKRGKPTGSQREEEFRYHGGSYVVCYRWERSTGYLHMTSLVGRETGPIPLPAGHETYLTDREVRIAAEKRVACRLRANGSPP